tara:strand:- start:7 stop:198 length:192 start_codon:yes stop_codon:yes gene_type:complete
MAAAGGGAKDRRAADAETPTAKGTGRTIVPETAMVGRRAAMAAGRGGALAADAGVAAVRAAGG